MPKLTLSIDEGVIQRAKRYAEKRGTSVSRLVQQYLDLIARPSDGVEETPVLRQLRGILKKGSREDYQRHLVEKYR